ncbi:MAG TPA: hypothetical protein VEJ18_04785 [Planctomycetota bacterium]|nr:hypothetical protein [Planctomycetota bacterium]
MATKKQSRKHDRKAASLDKEIEKFGGADPSRLAGMSRAGAGRAQAEMAASRRKAATGKGAAARRRVLKGRTG